MKERDSCLLGKQRKLTLTGAERLIWVEGTGSTLSVLATPSGRIGGLICWEIYIPYLKSERVCILRSGDLDMRG